VSGVLTLGESMGLVRGEGVGGFEHLATARIDTGGAEGNTAIGLARLGVPVTWLGRVGDDALGRRVVGDLRSEGVTALGIIDAGASTGLMLKSAPHAGSTDVAYYRSGSAGSRLSPGDLDEVDIAAFALLHVTGITLALSESARASAQAAVRRAKDAGVVVSFAVNHRSRLWEAGDAARAAYRAVLAEADIVFASEDEARMLTGEADPAAAAAALAEAGPSDAIVTLGAAGAVAHIDGAAHAVAAVPVTVVDTVGAGDAFAAGYLAERLAGADPAGRLRTAAIAGAYACRHPGDWAGAPRRSDLDRPEAGDPVSR
jgi:2-dehydro-3-deoxygluconokinase